MGRPCLERPQPRALGEPEPRSSHVRDWGGRRPWPCSSRAGKAGARRHRVLACLGAQGAALVPARFLHKLPSSRAGCEAAAGRPSRALPVSGAYGCPAGFRPYQQTEVRASRSLSQLPQLHEDRFL